jgi:cytochrome c-type biogenesis protein CcmH/NrfG
MLDLLRNSLLENLQNTNSLIAISHLFAEEGDYKTAVRYLRQAATLLPENADIKRDIATYEAMMK